jgi:hypothetical protein
MLAVWSWIKMLALIVHSQTPDEADQGALNNSTAAGAALQISRRAKASTVVPSQRSRSHMSVKMKRSQPELATEILQMY